MTARLFPVDGARHNSKFVAVLSHPTLEVRQILRIFCAPNKELAQYLTITQNVASKAFVRAKSDNHFYAPALKTTVVLVTLSSC